MGLVTARGGPSNHTWVGMPPVGGPVPVDPDRAPAVDLVPSAVARQPIRATPPPPSARGAIAVVCVVVAWALSAALGHRMAYRAGLEPTALFVHLAALVAGFGAVIALDWLGVLWLFGRRTLREVSRSAAGLHPLIWGSLALLMISGALLHPDTTSALTRVKLALVLVIALNGLFAMALQPELERHCARPPVGLLIRVGATAALSQLGWWTTMFIGYVHRR